jgi:hypothetical protein
MIVGIDVSSRSFMLVSCHARDDCSDEISAKCILNQNTTRKLNCRHDSILKQEVRMVKCLALARPRFSEKIEEDVSVTPEFP